MENLKNVIREINKKSGENVVTDADSCIVEAIPTGILPLDVALGIGGLPKGRIIEMHSLPSVGKSSLCLAIISNFQKQGLKCAYVDTELSFITEYAKSFGVNTKELFLAQLATGEEALEATEALVRSGEIKLIVVDSISGLVPSSEAEAEHGKITIGAQAKLVSKGLAKLVYPMKKYGTIIIFINQLRMNIMGGQYDPYTLPGGLSLRHYSSVMLELHRKGALMQGDNQVGVEIEIKVKKNKVGNPNEKCSLKFFYGKGWSAEADIMDMAEKMGIIEREGNTYSFGDIKLGVGQYKTRKFLEDNTEIMAQIKERLISPTLSTPPVL